MKNKQRGFCALLKSFDRNPEAVEVILFGAEDLPYRMSPGQQDGNVACRWSHTGIQRLWIAKVMWMKDEILSLVPPPFSHNHLAVGSCVDGAGTRNKRTQTFSVRSIHIEIKVAS